MNSRFQAISFRCTVLPFRQRMGTLYPSLRTRFLGTLLPEKIRCALRGVVEAIHLEEALDVDGIRAVEPRRYLAHLR